MGKFYLGCDVSKGYADFVIIDQAKRVVESNFQLDDTIAGHQLLEQILKAFFEKKPDAMLFAAVESTGGYENNWLHAFQRIGTRFAIQATRLNPVGVHHDKQAAMKRNSTDKISALAIAEYQINHAEAIRYNEADSYQSMRKLYSSYRMLLKVRTQLLNQLESWVYSGNTELVQYRKDNTPKWLLHLLSQYPTAPLLAQAQAEQVAKIPYLGADRAQKLVAEAQTSVASVTDLPAQIMIKTLADQILQLDEAIKATQQQAQSFVQFREIALISSIDSIGPISAIGLFIEMGGCVGVFKNAKKLSAYWGLHPVLKESGDGSYKPRMSKAGRKWPRAILFMAVLNGIRAKNFIYAIYLRELQKGKAKRSAIGICMNKLARIIYGVLKNDTVFDAEIDNHHRLRSAPKKLRSNVLDSRRFQKQDDQAPISRKQSQKRKGREQSQSEPVAISEIKSSPLHGYA
ncbi:MAG: Transposase IS116/IS110/IS902 family protein [bacterium ADurb.Bin478]|nr:MAG: Transposase IS116/IS110/IS902 family protein [bacterium ADurb.Bin478]